MRVFLIIIIILNFFGGFKAYSCGGGEEYYDSGYGYNYFFPSGLLRDSSLVHFFPEVTSCDICGANLKKAIVNEWAEKYPNITLIDIENALFSNLNEENIESLRNGNNPEPGNSFYTHILNNNLTEVINYLDFIYYENKLFLGSNNEGSYYDPEEKDFETAANLLISANELLEGEKDAFFKQKYFFQIIKINHYLENYQKVVTDFEAHYTENEGNKYIRGLTYYRTLGYYAGAVRKSGNPIKAKYLFSIIFDKSIPLRYQAYKDFKYIDLQKDGIEAVLAMAKNDGERSAILVADNIYNNTVDIGVLRELYEKDSTLHRFELALVKQMNNFRSRYVSDLMKGEEVNKEKVHKSFIINNFQNHSTPSQNWFMAMYHSIINFFYNLFHDEEKGTDYAFNDIPDVDYKPFTYQEPWIPELIEILEKGKNDKRTTNKDLYILFISYLQCTSGEFEDAKSNLKRLSNKNSSVNELSTYLLLWNDLLSAKTLPRELEDKIMKFLKKNSSPWELEGELLKRYFVEKQYSKAYQAIKNHNKIIFFGEKDIQDIIKEKGKSLSSTYTSYFGKIDLQDLKRSYARRLFMEGKFHDAAVINNDALEFNNPDNIDKHYSVSYTTFDSLNKLGTAEGFLKIADYLSHSTSLPYNEIPCYNSFYSYVYTSHNFYGVAELAEVVTSRINYNTKLEYSTDLAESFYRKAFHLYTNDEQKAACLVKAQRVSMKDKYVFKDRDYSEEQGKNTYYTELSTNYGETKVVQELQNSRSFYRDGKVTYY